MACLRPCVAGPQQTSPSESGRVAQKFTRAALHSCRVRTEMGEFDVEAFVARLDRMGMKLTAVPLADGKLRISRWRMAGAVEHAQ